ncbi:MAG TPA: hypothetical protein VHD56_19565 [Tepidisphaeraceae bacterium]|nr:hypothetical protein [Tepidisphaeraceae bacterium]
MSQGVAQDQGIGKLVLPREQALSLLQAQFKKGSQVKALRIRNQQELDAARARKLAWTNQMIELLTGLFGNSSVADQCNDWVGKIYPEYAELGNFVEQFYAEMEHRLKRLKAVIAAVQKTHSTSRVNTEESKASDIKTPPSITESEAAAAPPAQLRGALICFAADDGSKASISEFLKGLGMELIAVVEPVADNLEQVVVGGASFGIVIQGDSAGDRAFDLGLCVGRLGVHRVCVLHPPNVNLQGNLGGICRLAIDQPGGWQIQLAKQLKRGGLPIDLNRLV